MKTNLHFSDALKLRKPGVFSLMAKPAGPVCNLNCTYCYYLEKKLLYPSSGNFRMKEDILENFIRQYLEAVQLPSVTFVWQGGEPTLNGLDFFRKAIELQKKYANGRVIENSFQTNGTRLDAEWCRFLADNNFLVGISIDGEEHNHDRYRKDAAGRPTFRQVMQGIDLLHRHKVEFNTLSCVNSYNARFAVETYRFLKNIGSGFIQFLPVVERKALKGDPGNPKLIAPLHDADAKVTDWSVNPSEYGKFLNDIFDTWVRNDVAMVYVQIFDATLANYAGELPGLCVFSETCGEALVMEHNGDVYSCDHFVYPEYLLGNIGSASLAEISSSERQFSFGVSKRNDLPRVCLRCEFRFACHGECPKHRFLLSPDGEPGLNYLCESYKMFFSHTRAHMEFMADELRHQRPPANVMTWVRNRERQVVKPFMPERNDPCPCGSGRKFKNCCYGSPIYR